MPAFGLFLAIAGATLLIVGQRIFWTRQAARLRGKVIEGEIVQWKPIRLRNAGFQESSASRVMYSPVVAFVDPTNTNRTTELKFQYTPQFKNEHPVGSKHSLLFDPRYPNRSFDTTWTMTYFLPALLSVCGALVLLIGLGVFFGS